MITLMAAIACSFTLPNSLLFSLILKEFKSIFQNFLQAYCIYIICIPQFHPLPLPMPSTLFQIHDYSVIIVILLHFYV